MENIDLKKLAIVGKGDHGKVYRLDNDRCLKVCKKTRNMKMEYDVLNRAKGYPQFPKVYECEGKYMIREYVDGQHIVNYIKENGFDKKLARELTELIKVFIKLKFTRIDIRMSEVFVTKDNKIKIIDTTRYLDKKASYPIKMLTTLEELGCKDAYFKFLRKHYPELYKKWNKQFKLPRS